MTGSPAPVMSSSGLTSVAALKVAVAPLTAVYVGALAVMLLTVPVEVTVMRSVTTVTPLIRVGDAVAVVIETLLRSLKEKIVRGEIRINLSAGIQKRVFEKILGYINSLELSAYLDNGISVIFDTDIYRYLDKFNRAMRDTDVLWTKPSELSFYCGLGIPILIAPPIGTHEVLNKRWLREIHTGITPPGPPEYVHEWLFDLRENGRLAEAAWDGFLKVRKLGTYQIEDLVRTGSFTRSQHPMER